MQYTHSQKCLKRPVILRIKNVILLIRKNFGTSEAQETSPFFSCSNNEQVEKVNFEMQNFKGILLSRKFKDKQQ